ncbi:helix-turn-helix domain-containing protein [Sediminitomix flava]|uniref:Helix-turn-helix protein n=1 Tax=Sediminitomix flava TaxID=379075 RepID=A0A315YZ61_SEDFL|nr:helix-turn-helix domain-containing protein [Sediminitomix flava]PWJ35040.1 helix-turn-helix protein [Sediminitomix flava]
MRNLEYSDRVLLERYLSLGLSIKRIAKILRFAPSTIYREIKRNSFRKASYKARRAHKLFIARKKRVGSMSKHKSYKPKRRYPYLFIRDRREILWFSDTKLGRKKGRTKSRLKGVFRRYRNRLGYKKYLFMSDYVFYQFLEKHQGKKLQSLKVDIGFKYYFKKYPIITSHKLRTYHSPSSKLRAA